MSGHEQRAVTVKVMSDDEVRAFYKGKRPAAEVEAYLKSRRAHMEQLQRDADAANNANPGLWVPDEIKTPMGRKTTDQQPPASQNPWPVDWYRNSTSPWTLGNTYKDMRQAIEDNVIETAEVNDALGRGYVIQSKNIWLRVPPLTNFAKFVAGTRAELNEPRIVGWRTKKGDDDLATYGKTIPEMRRLSERNNYYMSQQHIVWALGASARTDCYIPPEFFIEVEVNGGTAGNGPEVLKGGGVGEPLSTIAMAHDTDWLIGRLFGEGPLKGLCYFGEEGGRRHVNMNYAARKAMGSAGLFTSLFVRKAIVDEISPPTPAERALRQEIDAYMDSPEVCHHHRDTLSPFLNQDRCGWNVKYSMKWANFSDDVAFWVAVPGANVLATMATPYLFAEGDRDSRVRGKNTVRDRNFKRTRFFPKEADR